MLKIAVTGVGGGVGQSIIKALSEWRRLKRKVIYHGMTNDPEIWAVDIQETAGIHMGDKYFFNSHLNLKDIPFLTQTWWDFIIENKIDVIIPGSDYDLAAFAQSRAALWAAGCKVIVSDYDLVLTCDDKRRTCQQLEYHNLPYPKYDVETFPCFVKPRNGSASRGARIAHTESDLPDEPYVRQEILEGDEYTCAVFCDIHGMPVGTFQAKRELKNGATYQADAVWDVEIHELLAEVGEKFKPFGPLNVQLKITERGPVIFELNCRCSGTTGMRAHFGYNEPEWMIRHFVLGESVQLPKVTEGKMFRYWNEVYG